jgi:hypothetical protein
MSGIDNRQKQIKRKESRSSNEVKANKNNFKITLMIQYNQYRLIE